jgi:hypothetical protein
MTHALTLTLPIKQDPASLAALQKLKDDFVKLQPTIAAAMLKSQILHFARVAVIDDKYIQVITEYEGPHTEYIEFFRAELTQVFAAIFAIADAPPGTVEDPNKFRAFTKSRQIRSLGVADDDSRDMDGNPSGWLFSAYQYRVGDQLKYRDVKQIQEALADFYSDGEG